MASFFDDLKGQGLWKAIISFLTGLVGWLLHKAATDKEGRLVAEEQKKKTEENLQEIIRLGQEHEKLLSEINDANLSDERISELLSTFPDHYADDTAANAAKSRTSKMRGSRRNH